MLTIGVAWNGKGDLKHLLDRANPLDWISEVLVAPSNVIAMAKTKSLMTDYLKLRCLDAGDYGIYSAYNKLIFSCRTSHICFHGADDLIVDEPRIANIVLSAQREDILVFSLRYCSVDGKYLQSKHHREDHPPNVSLGRNTTPATPEVVYPVAVLKAVGGADTSFRIAGDADLYFRVRARSKRVDIAIDFAEMRDGGASTAARYAWTVYLENRRIAQNYDQKLGSLHRLTAFCALGGRAILFRVGGERFSDVVTDLIRGLIGKPPRYTCR